MVDNLLLCKTFLTFSQSIFFLAFIQSLFPALMLYATFSARKLKYERGDSSVIYRFKMTHGKNKRNFQGFTHRGVYQEKEGCLEGLC